MAPSAILTGLLDALPDGVLALDDQGCLVYANPAGAIALLAVRCHPQDSHS
jgi:PAS domain-containing protein